MAIVRQNSFDGPDETAVTVANSGDHGDAFDTVDASGVTYDADGAYEGAASLRLDDPDSSNGLAWTGLSLTDCALRLYLKRSAAAESGNIWWNNSIGSAGLGVGGDIGTASLLLEDAVPADTWCRVEFTRSGTSGTLAVWSASPEGIGPPDASTSGTVDDSEITQWWLEHQGEAIWIDAWALADTADEIGPATPEPMANSADGPHDTAVTTANSAAHGDPWGSVDADIIYQNTAYTGLGSIRFGSGFTGGRGVAWYPRQGLADMAARGYLRRDGSAESGHIAWSDGLSGAVLTSGGGIDWAGLSLPSGAVPADMWCRVELRRVGTTGHLEVWSADPQSTGAADAAASGTVVADTVSQWWWERYGTGGIWWDELALAADGSVLGPVSIPESTGLFLGAGMPMFAA